MLSPSLKRILIPAHRWLALAFTPIFLAILLSGAVLAVKPMLPPEPPAAATAHAVAQVLAQIDPEGRATAVSGALGGHGLAVTVPQSEDAGVYSILTGERIGEMPFDVFAFAKSLHVGLLSDSRLLVEIAAWVMAGLLLIAPLLARPRLRGTVRGVHVLFGWVALPLLLLTPVTAVLMTLHVGRAELPLPRPQHAVPLVQAVEEAGQGRLRDAFVSARRFKGGSVLVTLQNAEGPTAYMVSDAGVAPMTGGKGLVSELHEGTWAGAWSGALNLAAALGLSALIVTGWWSWLKRRVIAPKPQPRLLLAPPRGLPAE
ncbi:MAG: PepSY domain-containing protein [Rhodospirillaceae bacterium]